MTKMWESLLNSGTHDIVVKRLQRCCGNRRRGAATGHDAIVLIFSMNPDYNGFPRRWCLVVNRNTSQRSSKGFPSLNLFHKFFPVFPFSARKWAGRWEISPLSPLLLSWPELSHAP